MEIVFSDLKKSVLTFYFLLFLSFYTTAQSSVVVGGGGAITCPAVPTATWTTPPPGISFSNWSAGSGVTCASANNAINGSGFGGATAAASLAANAYYNISISSDATHTFTLQSLLWLTTVSNNSACNFSVYYSLNGGPITAFGATGNNTTSNTFNGNVNVGTSSTILLYLVPYGTNNNTRTVRFENGSVITISSASTLAPLNDNCGSAQTIIPNGPCLNGTTINANDSWLNSIGCQNGGNNSFHPDVWYSFVATAAQVQIGVTTSGTFTGNVEIILASGTCGGTFTIIGTQCLASPANPTFTGLVAGNTYYYSVSNALNGITGPFQTCVTAPQPPINDNPCNAISLSVNTSCIYSQYTTVNATSTSIVSSPSCSLYSGGDVWFQLTIPASGYVLINTESGVITDGALAVYTGNCNALTEIACDDDGGTGFMPVISLNNQTPGSTIWVRFWEFGNDNSGTFGICASQIIPTVQDCPSAIPICGNVYTQTVSYSGTGVIPNEINPANSCLANGERADVWYTFTVQNSGNLSFSITPINAADDYDWAVYNLTNANCSDIFSNAGLNVSCNFSSTFGVTGPTGGSALNNQGAGGTPFNAAIPVVAGQTYVINVSNFSQSSGGYTINLSNTTAVIIDNVPPRLILASPQSACGGNQITLSISENVLCSSIDATDFTLTGPGGPYTVTSVASSSCSIGGLYTNDVLLTVSPSISVQGNYSVCLSGSSVIDLCGNIGVSGATSCVPFIITSTPVPTASPVNYCQNTLSIPLTATLTGGATATLNWYTVAVGGVSSSTAPTPSTASAGVTTYWVSQTVNGCESVRVPITVTVTASVIPLFSSIPTSICNGASVPVLPTTSLNGIAGTWVPSVINNTTSGSYTFTPSNFGTCNTPVIYNITVYELPIIYPHGTNPSCNVPPCNGMATVDVVGGTRPYSYNWVNGGVTIGITQSISNLCAGTYDITVTDSLGCTSGAFTPVTNNCIQIQSVLVDACETDEGYGEMVFFQVGQNSINVSSMNVVWPSNTWQGITTNQTYINNANVTITGGGILLPVPVNGILPPNANVVIITGVTPSSLMSFSNLTDTLYVIFQNNTTVISGHFGNVSASAGIRTLVMNFGVGCTDTVRYDNSLLINQNGLSGGNAALNNGAYVNYASNGNASYVNNSCRIPFTIQSDSVRLTAPLPTQPLFNAIGPICSGVTPLPTMFPNTSINGFTGTWSPSSINTSTTTTYTFTHTPGTCVKDTSITVIVKLPTQSITSITRCNNQLPYNWNGTNYNAAGVYTFTTTNSVGCDSLAIVNLTVKLTTQSTTNITRCNNQLPYNWNGTNYNAAGSYTFTTTNAAGCDSLAIVNLTVTNTTQSTTNVTRCNNQLPYNWNGTNYNAAGSYTFTTTNAAGCDSLAIVNLAVKLTTQSTTNVIRCNNQLPYNWNGTNYNAAGSYTFTTTNAAGCDSLAIVNLTLKVTTQSTANITRCINQLPYNWNGTNYNAAGAYTFTTTNSVGCDSLAILNLTANNISLSSTSLTVCPAQLPYLWNGLTFVGASTQSVNLINAFGCDSLATLILSVNSTSSSTANISVCQYDLPYVWNGTSYNSAGAYTFGPVPNSVNCDSIAILNLSIKQPTQSTTNVTSCNNQLPYTWNGTNYNVAGSYTFTTTNAVGCDSLAIVNLAVKVTTQSITNVIRCNNQLPYNWNGTNYNASGAYTFTTSNAAGCDSLAIVNLAITNTTQSTVNITRCNNQLPYNWNGTNYNAAGSYTFTTINSVGCDSLAIVNLTVKLRTQSSTNITRCNNQLPYNWNGTNYNAAGSYTFTTTNAAGCDSLAIVNLTVTNTTQSTTSVTRCNNQLPYNWNGTNYNAAGSYTFTTTNAEGCDSLAIVNLTITNTTQSTTNITRCNNQLPYDWNGTNYNAAGSYTFTTTNAAGCDSSAIVNLAINNTTQSTTNVTRCSNQLPYNWNGTNYNAAGAYTFTTTNAAGCDSLAIVNLTVNNTSLSSASLTVCPAQLPYLWNGITFVGASTQSVNLINAFGCDSLATLILSVSSTSSSTTNIFVCQNALPYVWNGTSYNSAGAYTFGPVPNSVNCDSIAILNLLIKQPTQSTTNVTRCNNQLPYNWNGTNYNSAGAYTFTTTNAAGCDSLAIVNLSITNTTQSITNITRCNNQLPYNWNGTNYNAAGSYTFTTTNTAGCDSLAIVNLTITNTTQSTTSITRCNNQLPYNWNGTNYNAAGAYTFTTTNAAGCDSLAIVDLTITNATQSTINITRCNNQLPYNWNGTDYSTAGSYTFTTTNAAGCDSLAIVNLTVNNTSLSSTSLTVCPAQLPYIWNGLTFIGASTQTASLINASGCDSLATLILSVSATSISTTDFSICQNQLPYVWNGTSYSSAGSYTYGPVPNSVNCDSIAILNLIIKLPTQSTTNITRCDNQLPYNWNGTNYNAAGAYTFTTTSAAGCDSLAIVNLTVTNTTQSTTNVTRCNNQLPYNWNGTNYNAAGSYTFTTTNAAGCDSLAIVNLTITNTTQSTTSITRCNNQLPYNWNGTNYNAAGAYTFTTTNAAGCDSLAIVNLTIANTTQSITNITRCDNQLPYNWNGTNYNSAGAYTFTTTNAAGCDSLAIVNLSITNTTQSITNITRCNNQLPYNWNGTNYNAAGAYTFTTTNAAGCDSLAIVNLTITNTTQSIINITRCDNQLPYSWNGINYNAAGTYTFTTTNYEGCDSLAIVNLTVANTTQSSTTLTVCPAQLPYLWNGLTFVGASSQTATLINASGCDSLATLILSVSSTSSSTTNISVCQNALPYVWNGTSYSSAGSYTYGPVPNSVNCDSIAILNLSINQPTQSITNITRCDNQLPYNWNGTDYSTAGAYTFTTTNAAGCDSLAIVNLTITNTTQSITNITRCDNQLPYNWNGTDYSTAGSYTFTTTNAAGCDSLAIVNLTITNTTQSITNITRCDNQLPYNWNGTSYNASGSYTFTTTNAAGCDSLAIVNLTVKNTSLSSTSLTVCPAQLPYLWNGLSFVGASTQTATLINVSGCDSLATLILSVSATSISTTNLSVCQNQLPYVWNGTSYSSAGSYTYGPVINSVNCDSIAILNLSINQPTQSITNITLCNNQLPYNWNGTDYSTAGSYTFTTTNAEGCDSLAIVNLVITNTTQSITNITRCDNQLPYNWNGTSYNASGSYTFTTTNSEGCDSLAIVNLTVTNTTQSTINITRCDNQLPYNWNGTNYNASGSYTFTTTNAEGCDSLAIVNLALTNTTQSATDVKRCDNQLPYNWNGTNYNASGSYTFTTTNAAGCDSLAIVNLTITNVTQSTTNITRCDNQLPYNWNGTNYNASGIYTYTTTNAAGCDSLAIVNLTITNTTQSITDVTSCNNQLPYNWNGTNYNAAGAYTFATTNATGCDSLAIVNLTVTNTTQSTTNVTRCNNQLPYNWNGTNYNAAGSYTFTTTNAEGCDSLAIVNLTVTNTTQSSTTLTACPAQLPYLWNGLTFVGSSTQTATLINASGCDSLATLILSVSATSISTTDFSICQNQLPYVWNGTSYSSAGSYTYGPVINSVNCDSIAILNLSINQPTQSITNITRCDNQLPYNWNGTDYSTAGAYTFTTTNAAGCDSLAIVNLTITNTTQSITNITRCDNQLPYNWNGTDYSTAGSYTFTTTNAAGCDSLAIVNLTITNTTQSITNITRCNNQLPYNWNGTNYNAAGTYTFTTINTAGCDSLAIVILTVNNTSLSSTSLTVCPVQLPYLWNGLTFVGASTQTATLINASGCDSLATLILSVSATSISTTDLSLCQNQLPYVWNGISYNSTGSYTYGPVTNSVNCDSIAILNLSISQSTQSTTSITLCNNQLPYSWNGTNYSTAGSYTFTTTNAEGCDSLAIVDLTITNVTQSTTNITRCNNQLPYNWNGTNYNAAGSYTFTTTNAAGCDSLAVVNLTITNVTQSTTSIALCNNQLPYNWNGTNYNAAGAYTFTTTNAAGCDSLAIVNLTITNTTQSITNVTRCNNQLPYNWNGTNYNAAGAYTFTTTNAAGCDSLAIVNLTVNNTSLSSTSLTVCPAQLPYSWNGLTFVGASTQTATLTNETSCDSLATLILSVSATSISTTDFSICQNQLPYVWNGTSYNTAGSYTYGPVTNSVNCDSIAILNLSINQPTQSTTNITRCDNQLPYNWNGTNYNAAGNYTFTTINAAGCDSLAIVNLTVTNTTQSITNITRCDNQLPYNWNGTNYNAAGSYTFTTTNAVGCDSLAIVNLTVTNTTQSTTNITLCSNQLPYNWNGTNYNAAGSYTFTTTSAAGCDSLAIVNLTVNNASLSSTSLTVCPAQLPYNWNGLTFIGASTQTVSLISASGCDSLATLILSVSSTSVSTTNFSVCQNQLPYIWNGTSYSSAGSYTYGPVTNSVNCDSIAILNLSINQPSQSITNITLCNNQLPYNWNGTNYNAAGSYTFATTNAAGCDSLAIVNLTVTNTTQSTTNITRCNNQLPFNWNGTNYNAAGAYTLTTTNTAGCDSLAIVNLLVTNTTQSITNITRCNNQLPYNWNGTNYNAAGSYTFTTTNVDGCDSLAIVNLSITSTTQSITNVTRCNIQLPYSWNGTNYNAAGAYTFTTTNAAGCDSLAIVNLSITNTTQSITNVTRCNNQLPFIWNGTSYNAAGSYTFVTTNEAGCDSLAILNLSITTTSQSTTNVIRCNNQLPYNWNGINYNASGTYTFTITNAAGCDSLAIVNLTVKLTTQSTTNVTRCNNQLPYNWNGTNYNASGSYTFTTTNSTGCDSLAIVNLTVTNTTQSITNITRCNNQLPYNWNGTNYNAAGSYTFTTTNAAGCDSLAIVNLAIKNTTQSTTNVTRCNNQFPYNWNGTNYNAAGAYTFTTTNAAGCDSLAIVNLTINNTTQSITNVTRCNNQLPYNWNGTNYNTAGSYTFTTTNSAGCDSLAIVNLTVTNTTQSITNITRCNNQLPYSWNGTNYNASGAYTFTTNTAGCDSLAIVNLTITNTTQSITNATRCNNQLPYNWNGTNYNAAGSYTFATTNAAGCDSLAIVNLTITFPTSSTTTISICSNELPYLWNGQSFTLGGTHIVTLINNNGCDSIATLQLSVTQTPPKPQVISNQTICQRAVSQPLTATGSYPLIWYTSPIGGVGSSVPPVPSTNIPGIYYFYVSQINGNCESPRSEIIIRIVRKPVLGNDVEQHICFGTYFNLNSVYNTGNQNIAWTFNNTAVANPSSINTSGNYQLVLSNSFGCYDTAVVRIIVQPQLIANAGPDDIAVYNEPYQLQGNGFNNYLWSPASVLNNPTIANPIAVLTDDTQFILTISDNYGCSDKDTVLIKVLQGPTFYIPNAFTPNGDGLNDNFKPTYVGIQRLDYFRVFDRYGFLVFETNNMGKAWDGMYKSMKQNAGNFVYIVKGIDKYGKEKVLKGNVLLIR